MTIALLTNRFPPALDGVGDYTFFLAAELAGKGQTVHVVCRKQPENTGPANVTIHQVTNNWGQDSNTILFALLRETNPDWLVLQYVPYAFQPLGLPFFLPKLLRRIRRAGVRICVMFHEVHIRPKGVKGWIIGNLQRFIARQLCRNADAVVTSNEFYEQMLAPFCPEVQVIPVGANIVVEPLPEDTRSQFRKRHFPNASFVVATFGNRDISEMEQAVRRLSGEGVGLLVCGVARTGYLSPTDLGIHLQCADLFVLPDPVSLRGEGGTSLKSGSLAAAFAAGLPVVGVRGDMSREPLRHGHNIWLAENGDAAGLYDAIRLLIADPALIEKLRINGQALYQEHLRWEVIARQYLEILAHPTNLSPDA